MAPAERDALPVQEVAQHPAALKRVVEMQFVEAAHDPQILGRGWPGFVVEAPRLTPSASACREIGKSCSRSIIALRSAIPPW